MMLSAPIKEHAAPQADGALPSGTSRPRLLLVEDNEPFAQALCKVLSAGGYEVTWVQDGFQAVRFMSDQQPAAAIIMDMMLPRMSGTAATRQIRWQHPRVPIIGISGLQYASMVADFMGAGGTVFLEKHELMPRLLDLLASVVTERDETGE